jgi:DNA invertase Pin-like site-specific DNA recombinase
MSAAVAYVRVSSKAQDLGMQKLAIQRAAAARGDKIETWFQEKASGKTMKRPEMERLRNDVVRGLVRRVYVFRLDRLTRSGVRDTFEIVEELQHNGVELVSVNDGFDLTGPAAEIILAVLAAAAKMERLVINERIAAARARVEAEGRQWGRPRRLDAASERQVFQLHKEDRSIREIAVALKIPRATVARAVARLKAAQPKEAA